MLLIPTLAILTLAPERPIVVEAERLRNDPAAVVCKSERRMNSRFVERRCHTRAEWEETSREHRRNWDEIRNKPFIPSSQ